jgi:effector-binding domain-containing protein
MAGPNTVRATHVSAVPIAIVQRRVQPAELPRVIPEACGLVWNALRVQGVRGGRHVAMYWQWSPMVQLDVGVEIDVPFEEREGLIRSATPAGTVVVATHLGPYNTLRVTHDAVHDWVKTHGRRLAGPSWEIYGHWEQEWECDPSQIRTDVLYLLAQ